MHFYQLSIAIKMLYINPPQLNGLNTISFELIKLQISDLGRLVLLVLCGLHCISGIRYVLAGCLLMLLGSLSGVSHITPIGQCCHLLMMKAEVWRQASQVMKESSNPVFIQLFNIALVHKPVTWLNPESRSRKINSISFFKVNLKVTCQRTWVQKRVNC